MKTKLDHILTTLENKDLQNIISLIPTKLMGGNIKHVKYLEKRIKMGKIEDKKIYVSERLLMSELYKMIEKYIVIRESVESQNHIDNVLLAHFKRYENEKLFNEYYNNINKTKKNTFKNAEYHQHTGEIKYEKWQFDQLKNRFSNAEVNEIITQSELGLIAKTLMTAVGLVPQSALIAKEINTNFVNFLEPYIIQHRYLEYPCISLCFYALKMIYFPEELSWFERFKSTLENHQEDFTHEELKALYFQVINYCIRKHNSGDKSFSRELLVYYKTALDKKLLLTNGYLSKNTYRNINTIALRLGNYEEAQNISIDNAKYLRDDERDSAYRFNMGSIYYAKNQLNEALDSLRGVDFDDHLSNLFAKTLMLKIYYEMNSDRLLDSHLDAMQAYLTRKKIIGYHKTNYSNIVKYTRKLMRLSPFDQQAKLILADKIRNEKLLPDRDWLLQQVEK